jgi:hypothetical protein
MNHSGNNIEARAVDVKPKAIEPVQSGHKDTLLYVL